jgi:hypothetical protein
MQPSNSIQLALSQKSFSHKEAQKAHIRSAEFCSFLCFFVAKITREIATGRGLFRGPAIKLKLA